MKKATPDKRSSLTEITHRNNKRNPHLGKLESMLRWFAAGKKYHRFSAEIVGDHALPSTISSLQRMYSIQFSRKWITLPNRFDSESRVKLYWLEGEDLKRVRHILQCVDVVREELCGVIEPADAITRNQKIAGVA